MAEKDDERPLIEDNFEDGLSDEVSDWLHTLPAAEPEPERPQIESEVLSPEDQSAKDLHDRVHPVAVAYAEKAIQEEDGLSRAQTQLAWCMAQAVAKRGMSAAEYADLEPGGLALLAACVVVGWKARGAYASGELALPV